jgi:AMMECR1 domain-containing protein
MSRARSRRIYARQRYLRELVEHNPARFHAEWGRRVESWADRTRRRANRHGAFTTVETAISELRGCGTQAIELEAADTERILTETATQAVARVVNPDLYVLRPKARG